MAVDPRDPHAEERRQERIAQYGAAMVDLDVPSAAHLTAQAITNCTRCDSDGYRGGTVCDHIDHTQAAERGMAAVRAALAKGREA